MLDKVMSATTLNLSSSVPSSFTTHTNSKFDFSVDYPSDWSAIDYPPTWDEMRIVNFTENQESPNVLFVVKEDHSNAGDTFDNVVHKYLQGAGLAGYPINIQTQNKVTIGNRAAYQIKYSQSIGSAVCTYEDYPINGGEFVPIISFSSCDENVFKHFMPIFEKMVSTFKFLNT
jgi:hypothetical protein